MRLFISNLLTRWAAIVGASQVIKSDMCQRRADWLERRAVARGECEFAFEDRLKKVIWRRS